MSFNNSPRYLHIKNTIRRIRRVLNKPPGFVLGRILSEISTSAERVSSPIRLRRFTDESFLSQLRIGSLAELVDYLKQRPYPALNDRLYISSYETIFPGNAKQILDAAEYALAHRVNLLGSGDVNLGQNIDWHRDYKSGFSWAPGWFRSIDYNNQGRPSDVKFPWEVSRMQWLIPAGQAYMLTGDEKYAVAVRDIILDWIDQNPYGRSVNWACTMEVALRIVSWTWFFQIFEKSDSWKDSAFRFKFLKTLYLHGEFTKRHLECSDINGNHYTADAAGLVFAGLFFGKGNEPEQWHELGWNILCEEILRQVYSDGVDFEASVAYHRLVLELFLLPALYRMKCGLDIPDFYRERLIRMARFTASYSRRNGSVPLWGDADDARALPFGDQQINDHRYLIGIVGVACNSPDLLRFSSGSGCEAFWLMGTETVSTLRHSEYPGLFPASQAFPEGGFYIMRNESDHIFIDCGPVGLAGRGGHGHNDCLAFEAILEEIPLITDCGSYQYTASYEDRNRYRSTSSHNTAQVDGAEINRFIHQDDLWNLHYDAKPEVRLWETGVDRDIFRGSHSGYCRLESPLRPVRTITLEHKSHTLTIRDEFEGSGNYKINIPLHLAVGVLPVQSGTNSVVLRSSDRDFILEWSNSHIWELSIATCHVSPSYGVQVESNRLNFINSGPQVPIEIRISPMDQP